MTAPAAINLQISLGVMVPTPAPAYVTEHLQSVEVTRLHDGASGFQLVFNADRTRGSSQDFQLLKSTWLKPWNRVLITVSVNDRPKVLMDGFITRQELSHDRQFSASTLTVTGEDVSILMDRVEISMAYPEMSDSLIVLAILAKYTAIGIIPEVIPAVSDLPPFILERTPQQTGTDRAHVKMLACGYGYVFHVSPGPMPLMNTAYWGPPLRTGVPKPALSVDLGPATNVEKIQFHLDASAPIQVYGTVQDTKLEIDMPLATFASTRLPTLATEPALQPMGMMQRRDLFTDPRFGIVTSLATAQALTDVSTDKVLTVTGELDTTRYGAILDVPGMVAVRGAGQSYDGLYIIREVTHHLSRGAYRQSFTLAREGTGSTVTAVLP